MDNKIISQINEKLDFLIIGHNATSYKLPLVVDTINEYKDKGCMCIDCKNIKGKYIVFDKDSFFEALARYQNQNKQDTEQ